MALRRTTVFADEDDLAVIKAAAARRGVAEAELIRQAIHLAALSNRVWSEPLLSKKRRPRTRVARTVGYDVWAEQAAEYERTKRRSR